MMPEVPVNYLAVLVSAIASMVLGSVWYGPLFGKEWAKLSGMTDEKMKAAKAKGMTQSYVLMGLGSLVMAFVMSHALIFASAYLHESGTSAGLQTGFWNWLGFVAPVTMGTVIWDGKPWKLWMITSGYYLVNLCMMGLILAHWVK